MGTHGLSSVLRSSLALAAVLAVAPPAGAEPQVFKIATLAPEGSSWMKIFHDWSDAIAKKTGGQIKTRYYAGGVMGDERDVVRKMRLGQINGAALTAVGLGLIHPDVRVLELPFLFKDESELDHVRATLDSDFRKGFFDKGYQLLSWGDVGPVRLYTNLPLRSKADLQKVKMWTWVDDPLMGKLLSKLGATCVPLGVPDVLPGLQTGLINACNGSPLAAVALQWHSKIKFATSMELSQSIGAVVLTRKQWDALSPEQRTVVTDESKVLAEQLTRLVRQDNKTALDRMKAQGIQVIATPDEFVREIRAAGLAVSKEFDGQLYAREFRERVEKTLADKRGK